jgi:hypothetical protein
MVKSAGNLLGIQPRLLERTFRRGEEIMSMSQVSRVGLMAGMVAMAVAMFSWTVPAARAGALRYAGKMVVKGTAVAAAATASGGQAAINKVESDAGPATSNAGNSVKRALVHAGHATTNGAKDGGAAIYYGAKRTPHTVAKGAKSLWRVIW